MNNNDGIQKKHGKITFVYAVKDSMFKNEEERSKFFEFILPVIPSITSDNVKDELSRELTQILGINEMPLTPQLIVDISDYISSRRILNNIISDFLIHRALLHINLIEKTKLDKLFSLMVLKNILPLEYERLQSQNDLSVIYTILNKEKERIQIALCNSIEKEILNIDEKVSSLENEKLQSIEELKYLFLGVMLKEYDGFHSLSQPIETFETLEAVAFKCRSVGYPYNLSNKSQNINAIEKKYFNEEGYFKKREKYIICKHEGQLEKMLMRRKELVDKMHNIFNMSFIEVYELDPAIFKDGFFANSFIQLMLVNGYIDETHMDYLSDHSEGFTSYNDKKIKQKINRKERIGVFEPIDDPNKLILILDKNRFNSENILNYYLVKELFSDPIQHKEKISILLDYFKRNRETIEKFVVELVNSDKPCCDVLVFILKKIPSVFELIYLNNDTVLPEKKVSVLWDVINYHEIGIIDIGAMNASGEISNFLNESNELCNWFSNPNIDFAEFIEVLNIKLSTLRRFCKNEYSTLILKQHRYIFNLENISVVMLDYFGKNEVDITTRNYDVVCELPDCEFKANVLDNLSVYLKEVYSKYQCGRLSSEKLSELLINRNIDFELKRIIVEKESSRVQYIEDLQLDIVKLLMEKQQIDFTIENILPLYDKVNADLIVKYINTYASELEIDDQVLLDDEEFKMFLFNKTDISKFINKLGENYANISELENDDNVILLIKNKKCIYCSNDFVAFCRKEGILKEYCLAFENEIADDIASGNIVLEQPSIATLYKVSKNLQQRYFDMVVNLVDSEAFNIISKFESPQDFWSSIKDVGVLKLKCKTSLLETNLDELRKEEILCKLPEVPDLEWVSLMQNTIKLKKKNQYAPKYEGFYSELKRRRVSCRKYGHTIVFN